MINDKGTILFTSPRDNHNMSPERV